MSTSSVSFMEHSDHSSNEQLLSEVHEECEKVKRELNASKLLFAEDLVSYIAKTFYGINYGETYTQECRPELYEVLNDTVKEAVTFIRYQLSKTCKLSYEIICGFSKLDNNVYSEFVEDVLSQNNDAACRSNAGLFIYYCVYFADLASRCYTKETPQVLECGVYAILDSFFNFDGFELSSLQDVAEKIVTFSRNPHISLRSNERRKRKRSEISKKSVVGVHGLSYEEHGGDADDESEMDTSENSSSILAKRPWAVEVTSSRSDSMKLTSEDIDVLDSTRSEQKLNVSAVPLTKPEVDNLLNLPVEIKTVTNYAASIFAIADMDFKDTEEECDDVSNLLSTLIESVKIRDTVSQSLVNFQESQPEAEECSFESLKPDEDLSANSSAIQAEANAEETCKILTKDNTHEDMLISRDEQCWIDPGDLILLNADRLYFASQLVAYIAKFYNIPYAKDCEDPKPFLNPFNDTVKAAVHFIFWQINEMDMYWLQFEMEFLSDYSLRSFRKFFEGILRHYPEGLSAGLFLYYSVYLSIIASNSSSSDLLQILQSAVNFILEALCTLTEEWDGLHDVSKKIVALSNNQQLYPGYKRAHDLAISSVSKTSDENPEIIRIIGQQTTCLYKDTATMGNAQTSEVIEISERSKASTGLPDSSEIQPLSTISDILSDEDCINFCNMALEASAIVRNEASIFFPLFTRREHSDAKHPIVAKREQEELPEQLKYRKVYLRDLTPVNVASTAATF